MSRLACQILPAPGEVYARNSSSMMMSVWRWGVSPTMASNHGTFFFEWFFVKYIVLCFGESMQQMYSSNHRPALHFELGFFPFSKRLFQPGNNLYTLIINNLNFQLGEISFHSIPGQAPG